MTVTVLGSSSVIVTVTQSRVPSGPAVTAAGSLPIRTVTVSGGSSVLSWTAASETVPLVSPLAIVMLAAASV